MRRWSVRPLKTVFRKPTSKERPCANSKSVKPSNRPRTLRSASKKRRRKPLRLPSKLRKKPLVLLSFKIKRKSKLKSVVRKSRSVKKLL